MAACSFCCTLGIDWSDRFSVCWMPILWVDLCFNYSSPVHCPIRTSWRAFTAWKPAASPPRPAWSENKPQKKGDGGEKMGAARLSLSSAAGWNVEFVVISLDVYAKSWILACHLYADGECNALGSSSYFCFILNWDTVASLQIFRETAM